jgi:hypothetical protein
VAQKGIMMEFLNEIIEFFQNIWLINELMSFMRGIFNFISEYGLILIIFIVPTVFVIQPLFLPKIEEKDEMLDRGALKRKKLILYRQIKELEMEFDIGNINEDDFQATRTELKQEVSAVIAQLNSK